MADDFNLPPEFAFIDDMRFLAFRSLFDIKSGKFNSEFEQSFYNHVEAFIIKTTPIEAILKFNRIVNKVDSYIISPDDKKSEFIKYINLLISENMSDIIDSEIDLTPDKTRKKILGSFEYKTYRDFYEKKELNLSSDVVNSIINRKSNIELIELLKNHIKNTETAKKETKQKKTSYIWQNYPDTELQELYILMIENFKLIALETTYEQFKAVFTGKPIEHINPIKWHQDNASELLYFINKLEQTNNIEKNPKRADYQKLRACFVKPDGKPFNAVWKSLKTNLAINLSPDKQNVIDTLVGELS